MSSSDSNQLASDLSMVEVFVGALPHPAIALDPSGRLLAFNAPAEAIAPALRLREPLHAALRAPALIEAVRRVAETRQRQRVEHAERVPHERDFAVVVTPLPLGAERG